MMAPVKIVFLSLQLALIDSVPNTQPSEPQVTTQGTLQIDRLGEAIAKCWYVDSLSIEARHVSVTVAFSLNFHGQPKVSTIRMLAATGGEAKAAEQAFLIARRAIIRCASGGYDLPAEKYGQWKEIEMTFNPERMRIK